MKRLGQRKCRHCGAWFCPDPRNARHQRYCSESACRQASKAASQRQWQAKPENQDYFCGAEHVARVRRWRAEHPGYWRRTKRKSENCADALQEDCLAQTRKRSFIDARFPGGWRGDDSDRLRTAPQAVAYVRDTLSSIRQLLPTGRLR